MLKSTSSAFQKCGTFCVYDFLKGSYWLSKFSHFSIFFYVQKKCQKKRHGHNFDFLGLKRIAKVTRMVDQTCYSFQTRKLKIVAVSFFLTPPPTHFFCWKFYLTLTANNSPLKSRTPKKYHIFGILRM